MQTAEENSLASGWKHAFFSLAWVLLVLLIGYLDTFTSMFNIWWRSETFAHGLVVLPISLWLIWRKWPVLRTIQPETDLRGLAILLVLAAGWLVADVVEVNVVRQLMAAMMLVVSVFTLLGWSVIRHIQFPLWFMLFAVPMGEDLIPPLMDFTAIFVVNALLLTGIPVYWEGLFFSIPSGDWNVVEGCSGVRYLIASVTLGSLYAYLTYQSYLRRTIFMLAAIILPVFANGMRAYIIVMIAHLSDMKLALGVDHFIYGWVFFGLVVIIMFWVGSFWAEPERQPQVERQELAVHEPRLLSGFVAMILIASVVVAAPVYARIMYQTASVDNADYSISRLAGSQDWKPMDPFLNNWTPVYRGAAAQAGYAYSGSEGAVGVYLAHFPVQHQGAELINTQNVMIPQKHPVWGETEKKRVEITFSGKPLRVFQSKLKSRQKRLVVWHWYHVAGKHTSNTYEAKLSEALRRLSGGLSSGTGVVVFAEYDQSTTEATQAMQAFLDDMGSSLDRELMSLDKVMGGSDEQ